MRQTQCSPRCQIYVFQFDRCFFTLAKISLKGHIPSSYCATLLCRARFFYHKKNPPLIIVVHRGHTLAIDFNTVSTFFNALLISISPSLASIRRFLLLESPLCPIDNIDAMIACSGIFHSQRSRHFQFLRLK